MFLIANLDIERWYRYISFPRSRHLSDSEYCKHPDPVMEATISVLHSVTDPRFIQIPYIDLQNTNCCYFRPSLFPLSYPCRLSVPCSKLDPASPQQSRKAQQQARRMRSSTLRGVPRVFERRGKTSSGRKHSGVKRG